MHRLDKERSEYSLAFRGDEWEKGHESWTLYLCSLCGKFYCFSARKAACIDLDGSMFGPLTVERRASIDVFGEKEFDQKPTLSHLQNRKLVIAL